MSSNKGAFKPVPIHLQTKWDNMIEGYTDAVKKIKPRSTNLFYMEGYEAKQQGFTLAPEVLQYMMRS